MALTFAQRFANFLASKSLRQTGQRALVVEMVGTLQGTFNDEEVVSRLQGQAPRATVCRTLALLTQADLLRRAQMNGQEVYVLTALGEDDGP